MTTENAINFLLFSYFGITLEDKENAIIKAAIDRADRDAFSRVFSLSNENNKYFLRKEVSKEIKNKIEELLDNNSCDYLKWHTEICSDIVKSYSDAAEKEDKKFTYGIAQKWINMTMKYLCVIKSVFAQYNQSVLNELTDDLMNQMHVPIDGYILECIKEDNAFQTNIKSWSKWTVDKNDEWNKYSDEYHELQKNIRDKYKDKDESNTLLDWEGSEWIKFAKKKREKEREKHVNKMGDYKYNS